MNFRVRERDFSEEAYRLSQIPLKDLERAIARALMEAYYEGRGAGYDDAKESLNSYNSGYEDGFNARDAAFD